MTLLALVLKTADLDPLAQALAAQREDAPGLFDDDAVASTSPRCATPARRSTSTR